MDSPIQAPPPKPPLRGRALVLLAAITCLLVLLWLLSPFPPDSARSPALSVAQPAPPQSLFAIEPNTMNCGALQAICQWSKLARSTALLTKVAKLPLAPI